MKRKVILRADGGPSIGMGHFIRTLALAEMLRDDFHLIFATREPNQYQKDEINRVCHGSLILPRDETHFDVFLNLLKGNEIVVLDNYFFDTNYQIKIKEKGCRLVCIDDLHDKHYVADVVINHAEGLSDHDFSVVNETMLLTGFKYALLRKPFYTERSDETKDFDLIIGIGGADPLDISYRLTDRLTQKFTDLKIAIIIGNAYKGKLNSICSDKIKVYRELSATEISDLMTHAKIGIFPSSTMAVEAIASRLPIITGYFVDNQIYLYKGLVTKGLSLGIEQFDNQMEKRIEEKLSKLIHDSQLCQAMKNKQADIMDKKSPRRLRDVFLNLK